MKKMKFTLGLMLSMLILGANVAYADTHNAPITFSAKGNNFFAQNIELQWATVQNPGDNEVVTNYFLQWPAGTNFLNENAFGTLSFTGAIPQTATHSTHYKRFWRIGVALKYTNGNDLNVHVVRIVTLRGSASNNTSVSTVVLPDGTLPKFEFFKTEWDRTTNVAFFVFEEDINDLYQKYLVFSVHYEIIVGDEFDSPGSNYYQPPLGSDVTQMRAVNIVAEADMKTSPNHLGGTHYVPTLQDFVINVESKTAIKATTTPALPHGAVAQVDNLGGGKYKVTIPRVNQSLTVHITSVGSSSGEGSETANKFIAPDAVWTASGMLNVQTATPATLSVYSVTGQLVKQVVVNGNQPILLPKGLYIVQLNGKAYKVIN